MALECKRCGACCTHYTYTQMTKRELKAVAKYLKRTPKTIIDIAARFDGKYYLFRQPCPFLQTKNYCAIYAVRPLVCRGFPMNEFILNPSSTALHNCPAFTEWIQTQFKKVLES